MYLRVNRQYHSHLDNTSTCIHFYLKSNYIDVQSFCEILGFNSFSKYRSKDSMDCCDECVSNVLLYCKMLTTKRPSCLPLSMAKYKQSPIGITHIKDSILHTGGSEDSYFLKKIPVGI